MTIKEKLKLLPNAPGIYVMKDSIGNIIYVGKSKNLKNRVSQYFIKSSNRSPKVEKLIKNIKDFDYVVTETELDALLLECKLIKDLKPTYNSQMKNYEGYPYIRITKTEPYPKISVTDRSEEDNELYIGPFNSLSKIEEAVNFIKQLYPIRKCLNFPKGNKACLEYHLGTCLAPCIKKDISNEYDSYIEEVLTFFQGNSESLIVKVKNLMNQSALKMDFEKAAFYRDGLTTLNYICSSNETLNASSRKRNIIAMEKMSNDKYKYFIISGRDILYSEIVEKACLFSSMERNLSVLNFNIPKETNSKEEIDFYSIIYSYLKRNKERVCSVQIPKKINSSFYIKLQKYIDKI